MLRRIFPTFRVGLSISVGLLAAAAAIVPGSVREAEAQPFDCFSQDPADWPPPAKPYFMIVQDTSGSMTACTNPPTAYPTECPSNFVANSCGDVPSRINDARCALRQTVQAFSGQVNFGLATFASFLTNCDNGACVSDCGTLNGGNCGADIYGCDFNVFQNAIVDGDGNATACGNVPDCDIAPGTGLPPPSFAEATWLNGGNVVVPLKRDGDPDNTPALLEWFDGQCGNERELHAGGSTPIAGSLTSVAQYLRAGWAQWRSVNGNYCNAAPGFTHATPLSAADPGCRDVNVILVTDGDDTCTGQASAVTAAQNLFQTGVTYGGTSHPVQVYVINFAGGTQANTDAIAAAGGTGASLFAANEDQLAIALSNIIAGSVQPEVCDNTDNNCNGCTDEGYIHYCNTNPVCCGGNRATCLANYEASITPQDPDGNLALLPCTTVQQQTQAANWLCFDPGETCEAPVDDNNCANGDDAASEGITRCGNPLHCPFPEVCNGDDDDCDGVIDNGVCGGCVPTPEVCDGCDNDCDGVVDDNIPPEACGIIGDPTCEGTRTCTTPQIPVAPGACPGGTSFSQCSSQGTSEICNGDDDDCDGIIDEGIPPAVCVPPGTPPGQVFTPPSQCRQGQQACGSNGMLGPCVGYIGPSTEICDGIDNDCDGLVDALDPSLEGAGQECGINAPPACTPGLTVCVNGALDCQGEIGGGAEICDGEDNDCDGQTDEAPLTDAPLAGEAGCWTLPGNCCSHQGFQWCPPDGADCNDVGSLAAPCAAGTLSCAGAQGWACINDVLPLPEACDGLDNNCDGATDEGSFPGEGEVCGDPDPPCQTGTVQCDNGFLDCVGDIPPQEEVCDGEDNDCDLEVDEGIPVGQACTPDYDEDLYPGDRTAPPCQPGVLECDGAGGEICVGGVGPTPELCDGLDNDCDGTVDETGGQPDGIDGTANPEDPEETIGDPCGVNEGICAEGNLQCLNARFECLGGQEPQVETCDCEDNDCNGAIDNENEGGTPPLCSAGKDCVETASGCQCAAECGAGEFPCPAGQTCQAVNDSETGQALGNYCIAETCPGGCDDKTLTDAEGNILCAPAGTELPECRRVPVCECNGQFGCQPPCAGVTCAGQLVCASYGEQAGTCVPDSCLNIGCQGCDVFCADSGDCVPNPCLDDSDGTVCEADQVCIPTPTETCKGSCEDVECKSGTVCKGGDCVAECDPACGDGQVCDFSQTPATCVEDQCGDGACPNGGCCDPLDGTCGACPCEGVQCPGESVCIDDECVTPGTGEGGGGVGGGANASTGTGAGDGAGAAGPGATGSNGAGAGSSSGGVFGLATGGGGCQCDAAGGDSTNGAFGLAAAALALVAARRRRRSANEAAAAQKEVSR